MPLAVSKGRKQFSHVFMVPVQMVDQCLAIGQNFQALGALKTRRLNVLTFYMEFQIGFDLSGVATTATNPASHRILVDQGVCFFIQV